MSGRDFGRALGASLLRRVGRGLARVQEQRPLPVDVMESESDYLLVFDAPGAEASDLRVEYRDRTVHVTVDRFRRFHEGFEMRFPGRGLELHGRATLPQDADVDPDAATATLREDGTLAVTMPKRESGGGRRVEVRDADETDLDGTED